MKIEPRDHAPKPLTKRFLDVNAGEFFRWEGRKYSRERHGLVLCIDNFTQHAWTSNEELNREVAILDTPDWEKWRREVTEPYFPTKMNEPATVPIVDMEPGQVFVFPGEIDGVVNGVFIAGYPGSITRLSDGKGFTYMGSSRGIPINGKFVEEDQPQ